MPKALLFFSASKRDLFLFMEELTRFLDEREGMGLTKHSKLYIYNLISVWKFV